MKRGMTSKLVADGVGYSGLIEADKDSAAERLAGCPPLVSFRL
jgi:hypothetical protein